MQYRSLAGNIRINAIKKSKMENKKQSSIEWLYSKMYEHRGNLTIEEFEQAKAMHKEEQENTWEIAWDESSKFDYCKNKYNGGFQQYYNETFGGQDNE